MFAGTAAVDSPCPRPGNGRLRHETITTDHSSRNGILLGPGDAASTLGSEDICCVIVDRPAAEMTTLTAAAAFFDLDKTIISRSSMLALTRPFYRCGMISRTAVIRGAFAQMIFMVAGADHDRMERIRSQVSELCRGWPAERVSEIVRKNLDELIVPHVYAEARALLSSHREAGQDVIIVSTSGHEVVDPIAALLGADSVIATRMEVADGCYTGGMAFYAYGEAKAARIRELAADRGYRLAECYAYTDSITDLPMLEAVGHPNAVNPDRALRRVAAGRGWPILSFGSPAPRDRAQAWPVRTPRSRAWPSRTRRPPVREI